jgi:hypothetical protein
MRRFVGVEHVERVRELGPGPDPKLAVGVGEMDLHGLPLLQESGPATRGEIESLMQRIARRDAIVRSPEGRPQLDQ